MTVDGGQAKLFGAAGRARCRESFRAALTFQADAPSVLPTPATHAISAQLKAGETVFQAGELPKTLRVSKIHYEPPKTVCETPFCLDFPAFNGKW